MIISGVPVHDTPVDTTSVRVMGSSSTGPLRLRCPYSQWTRASRSCRTSAPRRKAATCRTRASRVHVATPARVTHCGHTYATHARNILQTITSDVCLRSWCTGVLKCECPEVLGRFQDEAGNKVHLGTVSYVVRVYLFVMNRVGCCVKHLANPGGFDANHERELVKPLPELLGNILRVDTNNGKQYKQVLHPASVNQGLRPVWMHVFCCVGQAIAHVLWWNEPND